nr:MAG: hypothetical protein [Bacteriophage sp.]
MKNNETFQTTQHLDKLVTNLGLQIQELFSLDLEEILDYSNNLMNLLVNAYVENQCLALSAMISKQDGFEMIEQKVPLGDASKCVRNLLQIIQYNDAFDLAANNLALEIKNSVRFHWRQLNPGSSTPEPKFINQFYDEVINRLKTKI